MAINSTTFPTPQAFSGGIDWSPLANLGNVYRQAQDRQNTLAALSQLGPDQNANAIALMQSQNPDLALKGVTLQNTIAEQQRQAARDAEAKREFNAQQAIRAAQEARAKADWEKMDENEKAAARAVAGLYPDRTAAPTPPAAPPAAATEPSPVIPAPLPRPAPGTEPPSAAPVAPAAPPAPVVPAPPVAAPPAAVPPVAPAPAASVTDRVVDSLVSPKPAAAAGITRDQIAELYRNPLTRPLATAFLQKQFDPGTWKYEKLDDGRLIAANERTGETKDVTPPTASGAAPMTKEEREVQGYFNAGKKLGMTDDQATAYAANKGKMPKEDLSAGQERRINTLTDQAHTAERTLTNIAQLKELSKSAWGFSGAGALSGPFASFTPSWLPGHSGAVDTQDLINAAHSNVANVAKTIFPQRVTNTDLKLLQELESSANQPDDVRQRIYTRAEAMFKRFVDDASSEAEAIRNKSFYKPGGGTAPAPTAPAGAKPSLKEFMDKARTINPGVSDSDLAHYWKEHYGG